MELCLTSTSPEASRLLTKRRCPFGSPQQRRLCTEQRRVQNCASGSGMSQAEGSALFMLMQSTNRFGRTDDTSLYSYGTGISSLRKTCFICQSDAEETVPCFFCERGVCEMCIRQCERCFGVFCSFCSTLNYEQKKDRAFCLSCHGEERKKLSPQGINAFANGGGNTLSNAGLSYGRSASQLAV